MGENGCHILSFNVCSVVIFHFCTEDEVATLFCSDFGEIDVVLSLAKVRFFFSLRAC